MKKLLFIAFVIVLFVLSVKFGNKFMVSYLEIDHSKNTTATPSILTKKDNLYIKESGEIQATDLYYVADGHKVETTSLEEDMSYDSNSKFFYKIITQKKDYKKYQEFLDLPIVSEDDFQNYFVIILYNRDERALDETDLYISNICKMEGQTHIILKQKDDASAFGLKNVFYAIAETSQLVDSIVIEINK